MRRNKKCARIAVVLLTLLILSQFPTTVLAATLDIASGSITINDNDSYTIFGTSSGAETIIITGGQPVITLSNLTIHANAAPAIDIRAGNATVILDGNSSLSGGTAADNIGLAGIRVAEGATLTIDASSTGSVDVTGGNGINAVAGAGIGSNGGEQNFGTIVINGGDILAVGGIPSPVTSSNPSAGAGIGCGGTFGEFPMATGVIEINGGIIDATGGNGNTVADSLGGAGIGSGSNNSGGDSFIEITITGGIITAQGGLDASGIGGGANFPSGPIFIGGTSNVTATGRSSGGSFGGAGIGGGDNGWTQGITITGNSSVLAIGAGTAAGIGGGYTEGNWGGEPGDNFSITISGNASVVAVGGTTATSGGAGIGSGYIQYNFGSMGGIINILDNAKVEAYGGIGANAIGNGRITAGNPTNDPANITIDSTVSLKAFTADAAQPAVNQNTTILGSAVLYTYTGTPIASGAGNATNVTTPSSMGLTWFWTSGAFPQINVSNGITFNANSVYRPVIFNWAFLEETALFSITASAGPNGSISNPGVTQVSAGSSLTYTIIPNTGYVIDTLTVDGQIVTPANSFTFTNIQADHTIHVTFKLSAPTPPPSPPPVTGDNDNSMLWLILGLTCGAVGLCAFFYKKRLILKK